jgi:hypothetical protein
MTRTNVPDNRTSCPGQPDIPYTNVVRPVREGKKLTSPHDVPDIVSRTIPDKCPVPVGAERPRERRETLPCPHGACRRSLFSKTRSADRIADGPHASLAGARSRRNRGLRGRTGHRTPPICWESAGDHIIAPQSPFVRGQTPRANAPGYPTHRSNRGNFTRASGAGGGPSAVPSALTSRASGHIEALTKR